MFGQYQFPRMEETSAIQESIEAQERDAEYEQANCDHDIDYGAGGTQVQYNGSFEVLDVCHKCGMVWHTGKFDSIL